MNAMKLQTIFSTVVFLSIAMLQSLATAQLTADFSLPTSSTFFNNATARRAVEAALADLDAVLNQNLGPISASDDTIVGSSGNTTVTITITGEVQNPSTGNEVDVPVAVNRSVVRVYAGARQLGSNFAGVAGPGVPSFNLQFFGFPNELDAALNSAVNQTNTIFTRGEGPLISAQSNSLGGSPFQLNFGLGVASITIDDEINRFHLDHTTTPASDRVDLYSVVLHEALHAIGMGSSDQWDDLVSGNSWTGNQVIGLLGSGAGVLNADGAHVAVGNMTPRITDGLLQESALIPSIPTGQRIALTELDLAILRDIGFTGAVVPPRFQVGDFDQDGDVDLADLDQYNTNLGAAANGSLTALDLNRNGTVDQSDFETHYSSLVEISNGSTGTVLGDVDLNGVVNVLGDALILVINLGDNSVTSWGQGDLNADGTVDVLGDALLLVNNLGAVPAQGITQVAPCVIATERSVPCGCSSCSSK